MPTAPPPDDPLLAAIDVGSNSLRLEIGQMRAGQYQCIDDLKETVRLGAGLDSRGELSEEASARGLACLRRFALRLQGLPAARVRAVATQTLREARNRDDFLLRAQAALGLPVEVISGREEARLIYVGVAHLQPSQVPRLVIDIGGRSTEMILGRGLQALRAESFAVGSISLSQQHFADGRLTPAAFRAAQVAAGAELEEALEPFAPRQWREALGASGTVSAVSHALSASGVDGGVITPEGLRWLIERCLDAGHVDRLDLPGLTEDRRGVIAGGVSLLYTLATQFGIPALKPTAGALRQGVIIDLHVRVAASRQPLPDARSGATQNDVRSASVRSLQRRFKVDTAQARRVRSVALALYAGVTRGDGSHSSAVTEDVRELAWACDLHEVGMSVSQHDHHRHSAYLLGNADAAGFSLSQLQHLAALILGQRGGLGKVADTLAREGAALQMLALRLAVIECHARGSLTPRALQLGRSDDGVQLRFAPGWPAAHPRSMYLLQQEAQAWAETGRLDLALDWPAAAS